MAKQARKTGQGRAKSVPSTDDLALMAKVTAALDAFRRGHPCGLTLSLEQWERAERLLDEHGGI